MMRHGSALRIGALFALLLASLNPPSAGAAKHTPASWRQLVDRKGPSAFNGQRKHVGWNRDADSNFVDDEITTRFHKGDSVDVVVELNDCMPIDSIVGRLSRFGSVTYIGQLVSCAYMKHVPFTLLGSLAELPEVAMVEWQTRFRPILGVSARAVQAEESSFYGTGKAARTAAGTSTGTNATGAGVSIAILDMGVVNGLVALPPGSVDFTGFDATIFEDANHDLEDDSIKTPAGCSPDCDEYGKGKTDPNVTLSEREHGTEVAAIALARTQPGASCRNDDSELTSPDCGGIAVDAKLVDVKVCENLNDCDFDESRDGDVMQGIDWVGRNRARIDVANFSISDEENCDGQCAICSAVNYLAAIGIVPVVGLGNANCIKPSECNAIVPPEKPLKAGTQWIASPAAASYAITVAGCNDKGTVDRATDVNYHLYLKGPRMGGSGSPLGNKPDLAAPAEGIWTLGMSGDFVPASGTSMAAPHVAGAAAILIAAHPGIDPASLKDLLIRTADDRPIGGAVWDDAMGAGVLDIYDALHYDTLHPEEVADLTFPTCLGSATTAGTPCPLEGGLESWLNYHDIKTSDDPQKDVPVTITADVVNNGSGTAHGVSVSFGYYDFGTGSSLFYEIGTDVKDVPAGPTPVTFSQTWTPKGSGHQCLQVTIHYGFDSNFLNNTTQRNMQVAASLYDVRVENPFMVPARFHVVASPEDRNWPCIVDQPDFTIGGPEDCPRNLKVAFRPPESARENDYSNCNVSVYATPQGARDSVLIGGVMVTTRRPTPCRATGVVVDPNGRPLGDVRIVLSKEMPRALLPLSWEWPEETTSLSDGTFSLRLLPGAHQILSLSHRDFGTKSIPVELPCAAGKLTVVLGPDGIRLRR